MTEEKELRIYKLQKIGRSYYLAIPKVLVRDKMLESGVTVEVCHVNDESIILELRVANASKEHNENNKKSGKNTSKLRTANGIR